MYNDEDEPPPNIEPPRLQRQAAFVPGSLTSPMDIDSLDDNGQPILLDDNGQRRARGVSKKSRRKKSRHKQSRRKQSRRKQSRHKQKQTQASRGLRSKIVQGGSGARLVSHH